jgi:hypothetical protein
MPLVSQRHEIFEQANLHQAAATTGNGISSISITRFVAPSRPSRNIDEARYS